MSENEYLVTQKEAADFLTVSTKSISRYRKRGLPYKLILNPSTGKQEVRFRYADLERWDEGRQLLATYARDGEEPVEVAPRSAVVRPSASIESVESYLGDLLLSYKDQIELLKEQLEDMREQLSRRDRQIDDLMRLMVGLQLEYKPMPTETTSVVSPPYVNEAEMMNQMEAKNDGIYEVVELSQDDTVVLASSVELPPEVNLQLTEVEEKKIFSSEELSRSIQRLRAKGKSYEEIARGLNQINVATLSGLPLWSEREVQNLLPPLVSNPLNNVLGE
ncbi:MAG: helix-turn-helix domain-containing protein [Desulfobulbus sp.]|nr:helix-turn-helix domain-containing protein [Desulfobulbus sp.]